MAAATAMTATAAIKTFRPIANLLKSRHFSTKRKIACFELID
jgi:hypothetical protein